MAARPQSGMRRWRQNESRNAGASLVSSVVVWIGSPLLFYMYVAPPMSHACSAFAVALFVVVWLQVRRAGRRGASSRWVSALD